MAFDQQLKLAFEAREFSAYLGKNYLIVSPQSDDYSERCENSTLFPSLEG
jgi:hypothetical protein